MKKKRFILGLAILAAGILGFLFSLHGGFEGGILSNHIFKVQASQFDNSNFNSGDITGYSILENQTNKYVAFGIFIAIIFIGVGLIVWSNWHDKPNKRLKRARKTKY